MARTPRILLLGQQGQVAWELQRSLAPLGTIVVAGRNRTSHRADFLDPKSLAGLVESVEPAFIVNAAAYTAVDRAESEEEVATCINGHAPGALAEAAERIGALLVHYSTDYVFDGTSDEPYTESAQTNPQSAYGRSKCAGEEAIRATGAAHLILRTSWVYGARGANFMRTIRRLAREQEELRIVADQIGCPTWSRHIAEVTALVLAQLGTDRSAWNATMGTYHLVSAGRCSWYDFATRIVDLQRCCEPVKATRISAITTEDYPLPAPRPRYSVLDTDKVQRVFGVRLPHWEEALEQVQNDIQQERI